MAEVWSTPLVIQPDDISPHQVWVGPPDRAYSPGDVSKLSDERAARVGTLRVGYLYGSYSDVLVRCHIGLPDNGIVLQNVDVPLVAGVPLPVGLTIFATAEPTQTLNLVCSAYVDVDAAADWGPTKSEQTLGGYNTEAPNLALTVPLEPWCEAVTLHNPTPVTGIWLDPVLTPLDTFQGYRPRPRAATRVAITTAGGPYLITQHYAT